MIQQMVIVGMTTIIKLGLYLLVILFLRWLNKRQQQAMTNFFEDEWLDPL
jgi:hypothetical protein